MFKNDRMMLILTGLVLAIFAGSMVQYGDRIMALMGDKTVTATQDDTYSVRAGAVQILDVLSNDEIKGPIVVLTRPNCGGVELTSNNRLAFSSPAECTGLVEFAYCVDADGACAPNAVKINVISVNFAQTGNAASSPGSNTNTSASESVSAPQNQVATNSTNGPEISPNGVSAAATTQAPVISALTVEMAPPALATPSLAEMVSPSMALASIRQSDGGLNTASATDQNIATQNSANIGQTATSGPATIATPDFGESSNISLGNSGRVVAANAPPPPPGGLQVSSGGGSNIVQLERGPEALASVLPVRPLSITSESAPLPASAERAPFAPEVVVAAKSLSPSLEANFSAAPNEGGPIALIALNRTKSRGAGEGESLNVILTEPGIQSFIAPVSPPTALAPTSARPNNVSVLERGPSVEDEPQALDPLDAFAENSTRMTPFMDPQVLRFAPLKLSAIANVTAFSNSAAQVAASQPNQSSAPIQFARRDSISRFISIGRTADTQSRMAVLATLGAPISRVFTQPAIGLTPAETPPIVQASLPFTTPVPITTAPAQNSTCEISVSGQARSGANIQLDVIAACKPYQMVTIEHAGLALSLLTDAQGAAKVLLPAMEAEAEILARFEDQSAASTVVSMRDFASVERAGVSWQANMNLDLSAIEFGAAVGSEGYISAATPRDYRTSRIKGGGYLMQLGDPSLAGGALAEVYTIPVARNQQRGTIALSIVITDAVNVCGQTIAAKTVRTRDGRSAGVRNVRFTVPACGTISGQIALPGAIDDIRLAGR